MLREYWRKRGRKICIWALEKKKEEEERTWISKRSRLEEIMATSGKIKKKQS